MASKVKNNKVYMPVDALARQEDFDIWYADGDLFLHVEGEWDKEDGKISVIGRKGGEMGRIKCDHKRLAYNVGVERYEYTLFTHTLFKHYFFKGMLWDITGSLRDGSMVFFGEMSERNEVHVRRTTFKGHGECFELRVNDLSHLRIATVALIAIAHKEHWRGRSQGEPLSPDRPLLQKLKDRIAPGPGYTYEELVASGQIEPCADD